MSLSDLFLGSNEYDQSISGPNEFNRSFCDHPLLSINPSGGTRRL